MLSSPDQLVALDLPLEYVGVRDAELARHVTIDARGRIVVPAAPFASSMTPDALLDPLLLLNVVRGSLVTNALVPLLFDEHPARGVRLWERLVTDEPHRTAAWLEEHADDAFYAGLRDGMVAASAPERYGISAAEVATLYALLDRIPDRPALDALGLPLSWYPSRSMRRARFCDQGMLELPPELDALFARVCGLVLVFVDHEQLSYALFENIVPLDRLVPPAPLRLEMRGMVRLMPRLDVFSWTLSGPDTPVLEQLAALDPLYRRPANAESRGGERLIFHCAALADALTVALRDWPALLSGGRGTFVHVNPVFRANRFEAGDARFQSHYDVPYFDAAHRHVSLLTMLVYLTDGVGADLLSFEEDDLTLTLTSLTRMQVRDVSCLQPLLVLTRSQVVCFPQRYRHSGGPFAAGRKVFLRTELIYSMAPEELHHCAAIGELFSRAVYTTQQRALADMPAAVVAHEKALYDASSIAHWSGLGPALQRPSTNMYFVKRACSTLTYIANGYDFYVAASAVRDIREAVTLMLLDYFNGMLADGSCWKAHTQLVEAVEAPDDGAWVAARLAAPASAAAVGASLTFEHRSCEELASLVPPTPTPTLNMCCTFHHMMRHNSINNTSWCSEVCDEHSNAADFTRRKLEDAAVVLLGTSVLLNDSAFVVTGNRVDVLGGAAVAPVNFAACWGYHSASDYIGARASGRLRVWRPVLPPVFFTARPDGVFHVCFDFFRNTWIAAPTLRSRPLALPEVWPFNGTNEAGARVEPPTHMDWCEAMGMSAIPENDWQEVDDEE